jgi:hypothetical protein
MPPAAFFESRKAMALMFSSTQSLLGVHRLDRTHRPRTSDDGCLIDVCMIESSSQERCRH